MKSSCCQARMTLGGDGDGIGSTHWHVCTECMKPCGILSPLMTKCIRCDKLTDGIHTCTPTKQYRAGIVEGLKMAFDVIDSCDERGFDSMYYIALNKVKYKLEKLIKQYSGDE